MTKEQKRVLINGVIIMIGLGIIGLYLDQPPENAKPVPNDKNHEQVISMKEKEAELLCGQCHSSGTQAPLSSKHPSGERCLNCHKPK